MKGERPKLTLDDYVAFFNNEHGRSNLTIAQLNQIVLMHGFTKLHRYQKAHILMALSSLELMRPDRSTLRHRPPVAGAALSLEDVKRDIESLELSFQEAFLIPLLFFFFKIIVMHGFIKLHNFPKDLVQQYLGSIELIPPTRSTLGKDISSGALLTVAEVTEDLAALGWHECIVRSLRTLKPAAELEHFTAAEADLPFIAASSIADQLPHPRPRPRRSRLRRPSRAPPADFVIMGRRPRSKRKRVSINALTAADLFASSSPRTASSIPPPPSSPPPPTPPPPLSPPLRTPPPPSSPPPCTPSSTPPVTPPLW
ncbi:hypothetical protein COCNU_04G010740 [Cocos nucifera]|uniref:DUF7787 domain-containing protein n=1 Tax=Cocos nucifera TaxID=13894 RepID=A0A8K0I692_COCNU|nr:hypothetical protein COCNU_04G010740 [Cocos nucifera]